ncbi:MAG: hypothetical protein WAM09_11155 [Anaerolineales bacterium]
MKHYPLYSRIGRLACAGLILVLLLSQVPLASTTQAKSNLQTIDNEEPPVDMAKLIAEPVEQNPIADTSEYPAQLPASGYDNAIDYTLPEGYVPAVIVPEEPVGPIYQGPPPGSEGQIDNTQPNATELTVVTPDQSLNPPVEVSPDLIPPKMDETQAPSDQDLTKQSDANPESVELLPALYGNLDDFNRPDGSIGASWNMVGSISIVNKIAQSTLGGITENLAIYPGVGVNSLEADIAVQPGGHVQYSALVLNYGAGVSNIFVKVQDNNQDGKFDTAGCYKGNDTPGFGLGFFSLSSTFSNAHMQVSVDSSRNVILYLSKIDGGSGVLTYICSGAPVFEGNAVGMGSFGGGIIDNLSVDPAIPAIQERFNRQDGPLGSNWLIRNGSISIRNNTASSATNVSNLATYNGLGSNSVEGDVSLTLPHSLQYSGFVLNYGPGVNNIFVKIQDNNADGMFDSAACYTGNNNSGALFGLGFFTLAPSPFATAHMQVTVDENRTVKLILTRIDGGSGSQIYTCTGAPPAEGYGVGIASFGGGIIDNSQSINDFNDSFSRPDGALGSNWTDIVTGFSINGGAAQGTAESLALFNDLGSNTIEGDISLSLPHSLQYSGFVLNYGAGVNDIFVKFQDNNSDGAFDYGACYTGNNDSPPFGLGFFLLSSTFTYAHAQVTVTPDHYVTITLTNIDGGSGVQAYTCSGAPSAEGGAVGIASYYGGRIDNVVVNRVYAFDGFNRPSGALGPNWSGMSENYEIINQAAHGGTLLGKGLSIFNSSVSNIVEGDLLINPGGGLQYTGVVLNYGAGVNNIFIKLQDNDSNGTFDSAACYLGNNGGPFGLGFFALSSPFTNAHLQVMVDASRTVTIILTRINGGSGVQTYVCNGAPPAEGKAVGIVGLGSGVLDSFRINDHIFYQSLFIPLVLK